MWCEPNKKLKVASLSYFSLTAKERDISCGYFSSRNLIAEKVYRNNPEFFKDYDESVTILSTCPPKLETCGIFPPRGSLENGLTVTQASYAMPKDAHVIASGNFGQVSKMTAADGMVTILKTPKLITLLPPEKILSKEDNTKNDEDKEHNEGAIQLLRSELMVGNAVCSLALPCAQGTPVVQYKGCVFVLCRVSNSARALCRFRQLQHVLKLTSLFFFAFFFAAATHTAGLGKR